MQLFKALTAFYQTLFYRECEHKRVTARTGESAHSGFCPDCGYKILLMWTLCRCRTCGSKRHPKIGVDGRISALYKYCQHCGQADYQIIKKDRINVHEMVYAILTKEIDYSEERLPNPKKRQPNPFEAYRGLDIVEGEVLSRSERVYSKGQART
jgi:NMD protein affecting ribosome stability and mRNA decay